MRCWVSRFWVGWMGVLASFVMLGWGSTRGVWGTRMEKSWWNLGCPGWRGSDMVWDAGLGKPNRVWSARGLPVTFDVPGSGRTWQCLGCWAGQGEWRSQCVCGDSSGIWEAGMWEY